MFVGKYTNMFDFLLFFDIDLVKVIEILPDGR